MALQALRARRPAPIENGLSHKPPYDSLIYIELCSSFFDDGFIAYLIDGGAYAIQIGHRRKMQYQIYYIPASQGSCEASPLRVLRIPRQFLPDWQHKCCIDFLHNP